MELPTMKTEIRKLKESGLMIKWMEYIEYYESGAVLYKGMKRNSSRNGYGTLYYENGQIYVQGEFKNGRPDGYGTIYDREGKMLFQGGIQIGKKD